MRKCGTIEWGLSDICQKNQERSEVSLEKTGKFSENWLASDAKNMLVAVGERFSLISDL